MPGYFPVTLNLNGHRCLVVGGGKVALRKVCALLQAGAEVVGVAPKFEADFASPEAQAATLREKAYSQDDLHGVFFVVAATDDSAVNEKISRDARESGILVNVVDEPAISDVIIPSTLRRGDFTISVSTGGASPLLAGQVRRGLEGSFPESYGGWVDLLAEIRADIRRREIAEEKKRELLQAILEKRGLDVFCAEGCDAARTFLQKLIADTVVPKSKS